MIDNKKIEFTDLALIEIDRMRDRVREIGYCYGENSEEYLKAVDSFAHVMHKIVVMGGTIWKDSDLSLVCSNNFITYGVVWFGDKNDNEFMPETGEWSVHS